MPAFAIFTRESTTNATELEAYMQKVGPTLEGHPSRCARSTAATKFWKARQLKES